MKISQKKFFVIQTIVACLLIISYIIFASLYNWGGIHLIYVFLFAVGIVILGVISYKNNLPTSNSIIFPFIIWIFIIGIDFYANFNNFDILIKKFSFYLMIVIYIIYVIFIICHWKQEKFPNITIAFITSIALPLLVSVFYMIEKTPWYVLIPFAIIIGFKCYLYFLKKGKLFYLASYIIDFIFLIFIVYINNFLKIIGA